MNPYFDYQEYEYFIHMKLESFRAYNKSATVTN